jgi:hypothetical protein
MRKLIVSNFQTLDGYYEAENKTFDRFFDYFHEDYGANEAFDEYNTELLRGAGTLPAGPAAAAGPVPSSGHGPGRRRRPAGPVRPARAVRRVRRRGR